jgi:hypothetical protein
MPFSGGESDSSLSSLDHFSSEDQLIRTTTTKRKNATPLRRSGRALSAESSTHSTKYQSDINNNNIIKLNNESDSEPIKSKISKTAKKIIEESDGSEFSHNDSEDDDESQYSDMAIDNGDQNMQKISPSNSLVLDDPRHDVPMPKRRTVALVPKKVF